LLHFFIVSASIVQPGATAPLLEFNDVFDPSKDSQAAFMNMVTNYPNFVAEEWPHVLTWDLFVGRYIWLDGLKRGRLLSTIQKSFVRRKSFFDGYATIVSYRFCRCLPFSHSDSGIFTSHSVLFANLIGPPGLLIHWVTCLVTGKGFGGSNEALENEI
jgi:hypothetical protein